MYYGILLFRRDNGSCHPSGEDCRKSLCLVLDFIPIPDWDHSFEQYEYRFDQKIRFRNANLTDGCVFGIMNISVASQFLNRGEAEEEREPEYANVCYNQLVLPHRIWSVPPRTTGENQMHTWVLLFSGTSEVSLFDKLIKTYWNCTHRRERQCRIDLVTYLLLYKVFDEPSGNVTEMERTLANASFPHGCTFNRDEEKIYVSLLAELQKGRKYQGFPFSYL